MSIEVTGWYIDLANIKKNKNSLEILGGSTHGLGTTLGQRN